VWLAERSGELIPKARGSIGPYWKKRSLCPVATVEEQL